MCNKYEASAKEGKLSAEERSNIDSQKLLQKYTYYYKRYKSSWDAIALTKKLGEKLEKSLKNSDLQKYSFMSVRAAVVAAEAPAAASGAQRGRQQERSANCARSCARR